MSDIEIIYVYRSNHMLLTIIFRSCINNIPMRAMYRKEDNVWSLLNDDFADLFKDNLTDTELTLILLTDNLQIVSDIVIRSTNAEI